MTLAQLLVDTIADRDKRIKVLESLCKECADYLDTNKFTNIHNDSYLHRNLRSEALKGGK
jgi:hypothetical protein